MRGTTIPGATLTLDGHPLLVSPDGNFLFGFGREAPEASVLVLHLPDGTSEERHLAIEKRTYDIRRVDGLPQQTVTPDPKQLERIKREAENIRALRDVPSTGNDAFGKLIWPAVGPISGVYGSQSILNGEPRAPHMGVDVAAPPGTPVVAALGGIVRLATELFLTGNTIMIDHGYGLTTTYAHLSRMDVDGRAGGAPGRADRRDRRHRPRHRAASPLGHGMVRPPARSAARGGADAGPVAEFSPASADAARATSRAAGGSSSRSPG